MALQVVEVQERYQKGTPPGFLLLMLVKRPMQHAACIHMSGDAIRGKFSTPSVAGRIPELTCACSQWYLPSAQLCFRCSHWHQPPQAHSATLTTSGSSSTTEDGKEILSDLTQDKKHYFWIFPDLISHGNSMTSSWSYAFPKMNQTEGEILIIAPKP